MDAVCIFAGTLLIIFGSKKKDENGQRTGGGTAMLTSGIVVLTIGVIYFTLAFLIAFHMAQAGLVK